LLIFGLYWVLFWQFFIILPFYITDFISPDAPIELLLSTGAWTIIIFQIPLNRLTKKISTSTAIVIGFALATICWVLWYFVLPSAQGVYINPWGDFKVALGIPIIILGIFIFSIGEQTQAPRFYEFIADMAPKGQAALFQGYAFLPIAIAWGFGGAFGGWIYQIFAKDMGEPKYIFLVLISVGLIATVLMLIYNKYIIAGEKNNKLL
jgi:MFS family permease